VISESKKLIVILGPTASGKSELAVKLAKKLGGEIISADSRQVYIGLNLASGKIAKKEMNGIKHHCLDLVTPKTYFTAAQFKKCADKAIKEITKRGRVPIIAGGTAFYINAVTDKVQIPQVGPNWKLRRKLEKRSASELYLMLKKLDLRRARTIEQKNKRRLIRAIEIVRSTGKPVPNIRIPSGDSDILFIGLSLPQEELKKKIKKRLDKRLKEQMIAEIKNLHNPPAGGGVSWRRLEELGLEPRWIARFLQGKISKNEMRDKIIRDTYKFVRHQMTWWKKDARIRWIRSQKDAWGLARKFLLL